MVYLVLVAAALWDLYHHLYLHCHSCHRCSLSLWSSGSHKTLRPPQGAGWASHALSPSGTRFTRTRATRDAAEPRARGAGSAIRRSSLGELGDHGLRFEVVVQRVVAHLTAPPGLLVASEGHRGVEHAVAVDPHRTCAQAVGSPVRLVDVARPYPRR